MACLKAKARLILIIILARSITCFHLLAAGIVLIFFQNLPLYKATDKHLMVYRFEVIEEVV
jgi:hypothetical protein